MAPQQLVYVHGAGPQKAASDPQARHLHFLLFGKDMSTTRVAHYANVRWPRRLTGRPHDRGRRGSSRVRRRRAIRRASDPTLTAGEAANEIMKATLGSIRGWRGISGGSPGHRAAREDSAQQLYRRADRSRPTVLGAGAAGRRPRRSPASRSRTDLPIHRRPIRERRDRLPVRAVQAAMRAPGGRRLLQNPPPKMIVAHSLGTIILYDVLTDPALANLTGQHADHGRLSARHRQRPEQVEGRRRPPEPGATRAHRLVQFCRPMGPGRDRTDPARRVRAAQTFRRGRTGQQPCLGQPRPTRAISPSRSSATPSSRSQV